MNVIVGAIGSGLGFLGSLALLVDVWPVLRDPKKVADEEYREAIPGMEILKWAKATGIEKVLRKRSLCYRVAVVLLAAGFLLQTVSAFL